MNEEINNESLDEEPLSNPNQQDFQVGILKEDPTKVLLILAQEAKNIAIPPVLAIKLGQALIKTAREVQARNGPQIIMPSPGARQ